MKYKTVKSFNDLKDENHRYEVGDMYPREGLKPTKKRFNELSGSKNKRNEPLIVEVEDDGSENS